MTDSVFSKNLYFILKISILSGIGRVILDYLPRLLDVSPVVYYLTFFIAFIAEVSILVYSIKRYKNHIGSLSIIGSLKNGVIIMGIIGLFYCSMAYIYDMYIDPTFQTNMTIRFTEQFSPDQLDKAKENIQNQNVNKSYLGVIMYTIWFVFLGATISLIAGSILKTNKEK